VDSILERLHDRLQQEKYRHPRSQWRSRNDDRGHVRGEPFLARALSADRFRRASDVQHLHDAAEKESRFQAPHALRQGWSRSRPYEDLALVGWKKGDSGRVHGYQV